MRDVIALTYDEAIQWMEDHYNHDGQMGDRVMDLCIQTLQRVQEIGERLEDYGNFSEVTADEIAEYILTGEDWV